MGRPKKNLQDQATEDRLLQAAEEEFGRAGFSAARLEDIAKAAQIQRPSLLYHFESKEVLYAAVVKRAFQSLEAMLIEGVQAEGDFIQRLDRILDRFLTFIEERPAIPALILREIIEGKGPGQELLLANVVPLLDFLEGFVAKEAIVREGFPAREAVLMIATSALVRASAGRLQAPLWGDRNSLHELSRILLIHASTGSRPSKEEV